MATKSNSPSIKVHADKDSTVSVRQIENGFLVSESGSRGKGNKKEWYNKEWYAKTNPVKISGGNGTSNGNGGSMKFSKR